MQSAFEFPHFSHVFRKLSRKQSQVARPKRIYLTTGGKVLKLSDVQFIYYFFLDVCGCDIIAKN